MIKNMKKIKKALFFIAVSIFFALLTGCSDNAPIYSDASSGAGYNIRLMVSTQEVANGGSFSVTAYVTDPDGNAVPDEEDSVVFSSSASDVDFDDEEADIKSGIAKTFATWEDKSDSEDPDAPTIATIIGIYKGATSYVQILLVTESF